MSEARPTDLLYGHLGEAVYDDETHKWYFTREPRISRTLVPLGETSLVIRPSITDGSTSKIKFARERNRNIKELVQYFPELVPGTPLLPELAQTSEIIDQVASIHDQPRSGLLALGKAEEKTCGRLRHVPIAALASGPAGTLLRLVLLNEEKLRWEGDGVGLRRLVIADEEHGWWPTNGSPIQQVSFAETKGKSRSWLAVRYHGATSILHPLFQSAPVHRRSPPFVHNEARLLRSRLDPNHIVTLPMQSTGGSPHADVAFNPWDVTKIAVVDQQGGWSIWELKQQIHPKGSWKAKKRVTGHVSQGHEQDRDSTRRDEDGWGAVLWARNGDMILIANRRMLAGFQIEDGKRLLLPDLSLSKNDDWILDMKANPSDESQFFVTTSLRIFWLGIATGDDVSILLSWRHFRHQADISLRMSVLDDEETTMVVLYSRLTSVSTVFTFRMSSWPLGLPLSVSDPFLLVLSDESQGTRALISADPILVEQESISTLELNRVEYDALDETVQPGLGNQYREGGIKFYQLSILSNNLSLRQCLYVGQSTTVSMQIECPKIHDPANTCKAPAVVSQDGFIVPNRSAFEERGGSKAYTPVIQHDKNNAEGEAFLSDENPWTTNFEWLERSLSNTSLAPGMSKSQPQLSFTEALELIRSSILDKLTKGTAGIETLGEGLNRNSFVGDVETDSIALDEFVVAAEEIYIADTANDDDGLFNEPHVSKLITSQICGALDAPLDSKELSLGHIYDSLVKYGISPLSLAVPGRVRVAIEKRLRDLATHMSLATIGVCVRSKVAENDNDYEDEEVIEEHVPMNEQLFNLPVRRKRSFPTLPIKPQIQLSGKSSPSLVSSQISEDTGLMPASQPVAPTLPTPDPTPSLRSRSSISSLAAPSEDAASQRLRALATLTPQPALPSSASDILRQWFTGTNPDAYDWEATQTAIASTDDTGDAENAANAKKRLRHEKRLKRQKTDALLAASSQEKSMRVLESQPSPVRDLQGGNSQRIKVEGGRSRILGRGEYEGREVGGGRAGGRRKRKKGF